MKRAINSFPPEVQEALKNYVYRLIDSRKGTTFYVGRGKGNRVFEHTKDTFNRKIDDETNLKLHTIREILNADLEVIYVIHRHGMDERTAEAVEAALIDAYPWASNIYSGYQSNDYGLMYAKEIILRYTTEEADFQHNLLMISINRFYNERSIYDAVRFAWKVDVNRAKKVEYVWAVRPGIIVGVFKATAWKKTTYNNFPEFFTDDTNLGDSYRYGFIGVEANEDIKSLYLNKRIPSSYLKKGDSNPIKYSKSIIVCNNW